jgi:lipopolysaccharide transport system ATP-binding protein
MTFSEYVTDMAISLGIFTEGNVKCLKARSLQQTQSSAPWIDAAFWSAICVMCRFFPAVITSTWIFILSDYNYVYDYHWQLHPLDVISKDGRGFEVSGMISLDPVWSVRSHS